MLVECTHCGTAMSRSSSADGNAYWSCPRCVRTYHSAYEEVFRKEAGARVASGPRRQEEPDPAFSEVKSRLQAWIRRLDEAGQLAGAAAGRAASPSTSAARPNLKR